MQYRPEIDGLRAVAVLPVVFFHAGLLGMQGGYVGVDVFFVISGYLITGIIATEIKARRFRLSDFYERRARRILPALFVVVVVSSLFAMVTMIPSDLRDHARSVAAVALFASNVFFWQESGYFAPTAELRMLLHTWSLAVEEQFYILFPLLLLALRKQPVRMLIGAMAILFVLSLAAGHWFATRAPSAAFYLLPTRAWELLIGAILAFVPRPQIHGSLAGTAAAFGLCLIGVSVFTFGQATAVPGLPLLVPTLGTALVILFAQPATLVHKVLSARTVVGLGLLSYSLYLWHQPLLSFAHYHNSGDVALGLRITIVVGTLPLAFLTWTFVERPFRDRKRISRRAVWQLTAAFFPAALAFGVAGNASGGFQEMVHLIHSRGQNAALFEAVTTATSDPLEARMRDDGGCIFSAGTLVQPVISRFEDCAADGQKAIVVLGDSHAMNIFNAAADAHISPFVFGLTQPGCRPVGANENCPYAAFGDFIEAHSESIAVVLFHQSGSYFVADLSGRVDSAAVFEGDPFQVVVPPMEATLAYLDGLARRDAVPSVIWLGPFVEYRYDPRDALISARHLRLNPHSVEVFTALEHRLSEVGQSSDGVRYIPFEVAHTISETVFDGQCFHFEDEDHLSRCGEAALSQASGFRAVLDGARQ